MKRERTILATPRLLRCLRPHCKGDAETRGLCGSDYQVAYQLVVAGMVTWEQLEREGKALPPRKVAKTWFLETASRRRAS